MGNGTKNAVRKTARAAAKSRLRNAGKHRNKYAECSKSPSVVAVIRTCKAKRAFDSTEEAMEVGQKWSQSCYQCPHCSRYHLTKRKTQAIPTE